MMDTDRLIQTLVADGARSPAPMSRAWSVAAVVAAVIAAAIFFATLGPRPDFSVAAGSWRFLFKFVVTLALLAAALAALPALARPGAPAGGMLRVLVIAPGLLLIAAGVELAAIPAGQWGSRWLGSNAVLCMTFIPLIGIGPLAVFLVALRHGAPTRPTLAGALAGLAAGGLAATFYAAHCIDDSPLFVATWYPIAVALLAAAGALAARLFVRW